MVSLPVLGNADVSGPCSHVYDHSSDGGHGVGVVLEVRQHIHDGVTNFTWEDNIRISYHLLY